MDLFLRALSALRGSTFFLSYSSGGRGGRGVAPLLGPVFVCAPLAGPGFGVAPLLGPVFGGGFGVAPLLGPVFGGGFGVAPLLGPAFGGSGFGIGPELDGGR